jgi:hypothetical protein
VSTKIKISLEDPEIREVWETALEARREVENWPAWKRGEDIAASASDSATMATATTKTTSGTNR